MDTKPPKSIEGTREHVFTQGPSKIIDKPIRFQAPKAYSMHTLLKSVCSNSTMSTRYKIVAVEF